MKPVRLLCYMFWLAFFFNWLCTTLNSIPIILNMLTSDDIAIIYSVIICEQKNKGLCTVKELPTWSTELLFQRWCLPAFITSLLYQLRLHRIARQVMQRLLRLTYSIRSIKLKMRHCGVCFTTQITRLLLEIMHLSKNITFASTYVNIPGDAMVVAGAVDNKIGSISDTCKFPPIV